jgi:hypothetical protein
MGLVVDKEIAKRTACHGYKNPSTGEYYLWSEGIIGMLSDNQEKKYCTEIITTTKVPERFKIFKNIASSCSAKVRKEYPKGKRLLPYLECMSIHAKKEGIEI